MQDIGDQDKMQSYRSFFIFFYEMQSESSF